MSTVRTLRTKMLAGVLLLLFAVTPVLFADSHVRIVRLSDIEGNVQIDRSTGQGFEKAIMNMPITEGVRLQTGPSGRAEVEFENGSVVRLADNSSAQFTGLLLRSDGQRVSEVRVDQGTVYVDYKHKGGGEFRLDAANESIMLTGDVHFRLQFDGNTAKIAVFKGDLEIPENGQMAKVKKDETFNLQLNDSSQDVLAKSVSSLPGDQWDSERTDYNTQYAANYNRSQYPYEYGYSDLNYYGTFFNAPGYGTLWQPFGVSALWDPFGAGAWSYYPSYGYMWVSGYPWGWTPYRYGNWLYVPAYGWAWQPGGWNSWNAYPVVVNAPPTWRRPVPPSTTGAVRPTVLVGNPVWNRPPRGMISAGVVRPSTPSARIRIAGVAPRPSPNRTPTAQPEPRTTTPTLRSTPRESTTHSVPVPLHAGTANSPAAGRPPHK